MHTFYQLMFGIVALQMAAHYLALRAEDHHILTVLMVRMLFGGIQVVLFLILDEQMHYFQFKTVQLAMATCVYELCAGHVNPILVMLTFYVLARPYFRRREKELEKQIKEAYDNDEHLYYYSRNMEKPSRSRANYDLVGQKATAGRGGQ